MTAERIYLDNAATSRPKPPEVLEAMIDYSRHLGTPGRGAYAEASQTRNLLTRCRERLNAFIDGDDPNHIIFTLNTTDAMNLAIWGTLTHRLDHAAASSPIEVVTSELDHNSALRPFNALAERFPGRVVQKRARFNADTGRIDLDHLSSLISPATALVAVIHASNVTGVLQDAAHIARIIRAQSDNRALFLLDAAQSLGHVPISVRDADVDLLAMPGHKGLLGPTGTGALYIRPGVERLMLTVRQGGTGFRSELEQMPDFLPDRFEPGSHNAVGIAGLSEGIAYLQRAGMPAVVRHEAELTNMLLDGLSALAPLGVRVLSPAARALNPVDSASVGRVGVVSFTHDTIPAATLGDLLERDHNILSRAGLHCAPAAHTTLGTRETPGALGAARLSVGPFNTPADIRAAIAAVTTICEQAAAGPDASHHVQPRDRTPRTHAPAH
ncbi:MAG: aminotransferase class V-fold PLP-dependent enzyme [Phycisphaerales bacterium]